MKRGTNETAISRRRINPRRFSLSLSLSLSLIATAMHANCGFDSARLNKSNGLKEEGKKRIEIAPGRFGFCKRREFFISKLQYFLSFKNIHRGKTNNKFITSWQ